MKIALAQLNFHIGNFQLNSQMVLEAIQQAKESGAECVILPELAICGYPPRDFLEFNAFIKESIEAIEKIASCCDNITAIIGGPSFNTAKKGKRLYNSAFILQNRKISQTIHKSLLPTYDIFDEYRYFEPNTSFTTVCIAGKHVAVTICEDLWNLTDSPLYTINPMDELIRQNPDYIINIAASPFHYHQHEKRIEILSSNAIKYKLPLIYVNHVGAQTELIFDGGSMVFNEKGQICEQLRFFAPEIRCVDLEHLYPEEDKEKLSTIQLIHDALVMGIKDYFRKMGFQKAILGLSGGIDSAVVLCLAAEALGAENVHALLLPSRFSSKHSVDDSLALLNNINVSYDIISIEEAFQSFEKTLYPWFKEYPFGLAEENLQARIRAVILMAWSNKLGYILLNTSNKSEAAVGYGTLYGDMCGGLSVLGDVYKTQVYELANFINASAEIIPVNIITKAPSAELYPNQKDSDSLPEYDLLDKILFQYIEQSKSEQEIIANDFDEFTVKKVLNLVNCNEYKRHQAPPILRVSPKAFGMGRRMPIVAKYKD